MIPDELEAALVEEVDGDWTTAVFDIFGNEDVVGVNGICEFDGVVENVVLMDTTKTKIPKNNSRLCQS